MRVRRALVLLAVLAAGCSSHAKGPVGDPGTPSAVVSSPAKPKPRKRTPSPSVTPTATPTPSPTPPPPATGEPVGTAGALLALASDTSTRPGGNDCGASFPDLTNPVCTDLVLDAGTLRWGLGRIDGRRVVRLLTPVPGGYAARYEGRDTDRTWFRVHVTAYSLTGHGVDSVVVSVRRPTESLTYDVLTWVQGGPLVLRAHRPDRADGRLAAEEGGLAEYTLAGDGGWVRRRLAWDGRHFLLGAAHRVPAAQVPPR